MWCRRYSISPIVTSTGWGLFCHASSLSVLCVRGRLSPLHEASKTIRHVMKLSSPYHVSSLTVLHNHYTIILQLVGMSITCVITDLIVIIPRITTYMAPLREGYVCDICHRSGNARSIAINFTRVEIQILESC